jgi:hypothetical protein
LERNTGKASNAIETVRVRSSAVLEPTPEFEGACAIAFDTAPDILGKCLKA